MKLRLLTTLCFCLVTSIQGQGSGDDRTGTKRTAAELDELLGPIALYPDALIAIILPAATFPTDIVLGERYVASGGSLARVEDKPWDSSVQALTRYPDTLKWLDENLEWTTQVGDAFVEQPVEVMESVQQLRARARAMGNLVDTPQQRIVQDDTCIRIIPAQADYIYEPRYDPEIVYYERPSSEPLLYFSLGYTVGSWLNYDFDWRRHHLYRGDWHQGWDYSRDNSRGRDRDDDRYINNNLTNSRAWQPDTERHYAQSRHVIVERPSAAGDSQNRLLSRDSTANAGREHHAGIVHPKAIAGSPHSGENARQKEQHDSGKAGNLPSGQTAHQNRIGDEERSHVLQPKSVAPGVAADGKHGNDARGSADRKNPGHEPEHSAHAEDGPNGHLARPKSEKPAIAGASQHGSDPRDMTEHKDRGHDPERGGHSAEGLSNKDTPAKRSGEGDHGPALHQEQKREEPKHADETPKHADASKLTEPKHDGPKHNETAKHQEGSEPQQTHKTAESSHEASTHADASKVTESKHESLKHATPESGGEPKHEAKKQITPKHDDAPKADPKGEASNSPAANGKAKGKDADKKKKE